MRLDEFQVGPLTKQLKLPKLQIKSLINNIVSFSEIYIRI